jgi:hypothetical protein
MNYFSTSPKSSQTERNGVVHPVDRHWKQFAVGTAITSGPYREHAMLSGVAGRLIQKSYEMVAGIRVSLR